ncbi:MAG: hypothetical protein IT432_17115 [Phycisphaerales bacterium]|nr:hypothetical protein [Phycisphaerales bacterium]
MRSPSEELLASLTTVLRRHCERDPDAARFLAALGHWLASVAAEGATSNRPEEAPATGPSGGAPERDSHPAPASTHSHASQPDPSASDDQHMPRRHPHPAPQIVTKPVALRLGDAEIELAVAGSNDEIAAANRAVRTPAPTRDIAVQEPADLALIARRASLKALACDAALAKHDAKTPEDRDAAKTRVLRLLNDRLELADCFLWMLKPDLCVKAQDLRVLRPCFENLALAAAVAERCVDRKDRPKIERAIRLLAEAQSALRRAIESAWLDLVDRDQYDAFTWLRTITAAEHVYVERHMRMDDPADPAIAVELHERLIALDVEVRAVDNRGREAAKALKQLRYHAGLIADNPGQEREHDWARVGGVLDRLGVLGVFPGDDRLTESVEQLAALPHERWSLPPAARAVLAAAAELTESDDTARAFTPDRPLSASANVVRDWLRGKRAVIIGGEFYPHAADRIRRAFALSDLQWIELTEHGKTAPIEPPISHPDTAIVWLIIGLSGHVHVDVAGECARRYHKPLVRLPAGYNPSQIAHHSVDQVSHFFAHATERPVS